MDSRQRSVADGQRCSVSSAKIGQEFVFNTREHEKEVEKWLAQIFSYVPGGVSF